MMGLSIAMCVTKVVRASHTVAPTVISKWMFDVRSNQRFGYPLPGHDHELKLQVSETETEQSFFCDFYGTRSYSLRGRRLHCEEDCNFKIDLDCAQRLMISEFEVIQHVSHEHWLIYDDSIKARDRKYCAACRKVCDDHPLGLSTTKGRERCDFCNLICQDLTFRCDLCNFKIDYLCASMLIELHKLSKIDHFSHPHSLLLHNSISLGGNANCYACWEQLSFSSPFYNCSKSSVYLHKSCSVNLIKHYRDYKHILNTFHNHPLEIVYYGKEAPGVVCCTLCRKCCFGPTYVCFLCKFFLHQSCLELLGTNTISQNCFHKHPLLIVDNKVNDSTSYFFMNNDFPSCSACGEPCFEKSFACLKCKFLIHELCLELPHEIQHFFHPCPLSLQHETTNFTCRACEKSHSLFAYHCNRCHFFLDVKCALMFTENFEGENYILSYCHRHPLILCNKERNDHVVSCDGCNQVISGEIYGCVQCDIYLHRSCATAPQQIEHPFHPKHTLTLFFDEKLLCTVSILKSLDKKGKLKYLRHKHFSIHNDKENEVFCGVCEKHVYGPSYKCIRCKFFIHQDCIEPVEEMQHPFQPYDNDSLIGVSRRKTLPRKKFTCDACSCKTCFGFSYRCEECRFKLDVICASLKPSIKYKGHMHLLTFFENVYDPQCEVCNSSYTDVSYLRCVVKRKNIEVMDQSS
uniref:Phorbol-ester/DAG-type domain-containing protein n=1 Tax=Quercus lobata TaxID=97700 RepID=A0A7N2LFM6_QUELO